MGVTEVLSTKLFILGLVLIHKDVYMYMDNTVCSTLVLDDTKNMNFSCIKPLFHCYYCVYTTSTLFLMSNLVFVWNLIEY